MLLLRCVPDTSTAQTVLSITVRMDYGSNRSASGSLFHADRSLDA